MKRFAIAIIGVLFTSILVNAQFPAGFKYQAVIRNSDGNLMASQSISLRISLIPGQENNSPVYIESHQTVTNQYGQVNLNIGQGIVVSGVFNAIDWNQDQFFVKIEIDIHGGNNFVLMGISPILAVPYAIHAQTVANNDDADADPLNEIQDLKLNGGTLTITKKENATEIDLSPYLGTNTDEQTLSLKGDSLAITNGNKVDLSKYLDNTDSQTLTFENNALTISNGNQVDLSALNNNSGAQTLSLSNDILAISNGNQVDLSGYKDNTDNQALSVNGTQLSIAGGNTVDLSTIQDGFTDADADPQNELQTLSVNADTLSISDGNKVTLPKNDVLWDANGSNISYTDGGVSIGTSNPQNTSVFEVASSSKGILVPRMTTIQRKAIVSPANGLMVFDTNFGSFFYYNSLIAQWTMVSTINVTPNNLTEALFAVVNQLGDTIFAVYPEGVQINVGDGNTKGRKGGFAVASMGVGTKATSTELLRVTNDSIRIYIDTAATKGRKGGFAVASMGVGTKGTSNEYLRVSDDSVRIYVEENTTKGRKG